jgi:enoyl-CoA hydratase/carnithine racemase
MSSVRLIRDRVSVEFNAGIAEVRLARPDRMNAIDGAMFDALADAIALLGSSNARAVVLSGEGAAFCAGLDKAMFAQMMAGEDAAGIPSDLVARTHGPANLPQHVVVGWRNLAMPVIAAVHGVAFGGGLQIALGADLRFMAPTTRCSLMEIRWGLVPDMGGIALLPGLVRNDVLRDLMFTGRELSGVEALALGIATRIDDDPRAAALAEAARMATLSPSAIRAAKRLANCAASAAPEDILLAESKEQQSLIGGAHQMEAVAAALQRRSASFADEDTATERRQ